MTELPEKGDAVTWGAAGGEAHGTVEEVVTSATRIKGHTARATREHPQVVVRSGRSGKAAVHRPEELKKG